MAGTYYSYAERNADAYVDWADIGKYTTEMLDETIKVRQEKKDALQKATRDALKQIADTPVGAHASARQSALKMADVVSKNLLIQEKLMKSGKLDPRDYLIYNQNALDGIDLAFNANKAYQENYQKIIDGVNSEEMSGLTLENAAIAESYGDWNTNGYMMSPEGNLMVGIETEEVINGQKVKKLSKVTSTNALNGLLLNTIPHNKLEDKINKWVPTLGKNQIAVIKKAGYGKQGMVITKEDITKRTDLSADEKTILFDFVEAEKLKVASLLGTPTNIASILFDTKRTTDSGIDYSATDDPAEATKDPSKILRVYNQNSGTYEFKVSDKQKAEAEKFAFNRMREKYDIIEKVDVGSQLQNQATEADKDRGVLQKQKESIASSWGNIFKATTPEAKRAEAEAIIGSDLSKQQGLIDIDFTVPNKITFIYSDPIKNRTINYDSGKTTLRQWNQLGNEVHGIDNIDEVMKRNQGGDPNMIMSPSQRQFGGVKVGRQGQANNIDYTDDVTKYVSKNTKNNIVEDGAKATAKKLETIYRKLGYTFEAKEDTGYGTTDQIKIKGPDGVASDWIDVDNLDNVDFINQFIIDHSAGQDYGNVWSYKKKQAAAGGTTASGGVVR